MEGAINPDNPLGPKEALEKDALGRESFARAAVRALGGISATSGFVASIEGSWGSGKTSTLNMIEAVLSKEKESPIVVRFNPWLVGDRDALIRQFFSSVADTLGKKDNSAIAAKVAKQLKDYSRVFDFVKFVPGAFAMATAVKEVIHGAGEAVGAVAEQKGKDLESTKAELTTDLEKLTCRIIVFVDDVDRLLPGEVLEVVRIIKAVGDLPNIGYVVSWDADYVERALEAAAIPNSRAYLDKIVQVRLPLPAISSSKRQRLLAQAVDSLPPQATRPYFSGSEERMFGLYIHGLQDLLHTPRDIHRLFNTLRVIEPPLRGEVVLADLIGLACLMVKAPSVYEVLRRNPRLFEGRLASFDIISDEKESKEKFRKLASEIFDHLPNGEAVRELVFFLFPSFASACGKSYGRRSLSVASGSISEPGRLAVAVNFTLTDADVSLVKTREYIAKPDLRGEILRNLSPDACVDFIEAVGQVVATMKGSVIGDDASRLAIDLARIVDSPLLAGDDSRKIGFRFDSPELTAAEAILQIANAAGDQLGEDIALGISMDKKCLTMRAALISHAKTGGGRMSVSLPGASLKDAIKRLAFDSKVLVRSGGFWRLGNPGRVIRTLMHYGTTAQCKAFFAELKKDDKTLDKFALSFFRYSFSSEGGQSYALPRDVNEVEKFTKLKWLRNHAKGRLSQADVKYPVRAAWQSVVTGVPHLGSNGKEVEY